MGHKDGVRMQTLRRETGDKSRLKKVKYPGQWASVFPIKKISVFGMSSCWWTGHHPTACQHGEWLLNSIRRTPLGNDACISPAGWLTQSKVDVSGLSTVGNVSRSDQSLCWYSNTLGEALRIAEVLILLANPWMSDTQNCVVVTNSEWSLKYSVENASGGHIPRASWVDMVPGVRRAVKVPNTHPRKPQMSLRSTKCKHIGRRRVLRLRKQSFKTNTKAANACWILKVEAVLGDQAWWSRPVVRG